GKVYKGGEGRVLALKNMDLRVETGEIIGILGPNGAGKTTAVKLIMGLIRPSEGEIIFKDRPLDPSHIRSGIGYLPESFRPNPNLTVGEYVTMHCRLAGLSAEADRQAKDLLKQVGMDKFLNRRISNLSKGMGQRVGMAQAFAGEPDFLILDEPTSGLDPIGKSEVIEFLLQMKERGKTILFCSHILSEVERLCDRIGIMVRGNLNFVGTVPDFLEKWQVDDLEKGFKMEAQ
ncbi:MAG: ABC transporter ATP-binding protein, partial [Desulfonatronovibrio sp.]